MLHNLPLVHDTFMKTVAGGKKLIMKKNNNLSEIRKKNIHANSFD